MITAGRTFVNGGFRPAVGKQGRKWTQVVYIDGSHIKVTRVKGLLDFTPIKGYTPYRLAGRMLRSRNTLGIKMHVSKTARKLLKEVRNGA